LKNQKPKATGLDFEGDVDKECVEVIDLNKKTSYGTKKPRLSKTQNVYESMDATAAALERRAEEKKKTMENLVIVKQQEFSVRQTEAEARLQEANNHRLEAEARLQESNNQRFDAETRRKETESTQQFMLSMMERFGQVIERLSEGKK
jgi:hypothetical protein